MTNLEMQALALAAEVQIYIQKGNLHQLTLALHEFRKAQFEADMQLGQDLEKMYQQYESSTCPVINLASKRKK